jgi:hypothetical protein
LPDRERFDFIKRRVESFRKLLQLGLDHLALITSLPLRYGQRPEWEPKKTLVQCVYQRTVPHDD